MNAYNKIHCIILCLILSLFVKAQKENNRLNYLSRDFYRSFNFVEINKNKESKYKMYNPFTKKFDSVFDIKPDKYVYAKIDSIPEIILTKEEVNEIPFWTRQDLIKLGEYFKIDSLINRKRLNSEGRKIKRDYFNYHKNFYIIERRGNDYYKIKVIRRERFSY